MKVVAIIQARMGSTRLPGKVLMEMAGEPMLLRVVQRTSRAQVVDEVVVATTIVPGDDAIARLCEEGGWCYYRGSEEDVLDRYRGTAKEYAADVVIRITADCPLIEPEIIDEAVRRFQADPRLDYLSNTLPPRSYPRGLDAEVFSVPALERAWQEASTIAHREHVTPYIWQQPDRFCLGSLRNNRDLSAMRWTVDTADELDLVRRIYSHFGHSRFSWREVLRLLEENSSWLEINRHVQQKEI